MIQFQNSLRKREGEYHFVIQLLMSKLIRLYMATITKQIRTLGKLLTYLVALGKSNNNSEPVFTSVEESYNKPCLM